MAGQFSHEPRRFIREPQLVLVTTPDLLTQCLNTRFKADTLPADHPSLDRFGPDGSIYDLVVTENLDFAHGEIHLLVRFSVDQPFLGGSTLGSFFL